MRPQTTKAIMRENIRRFNKCTYSEKRRKRQSKRSNKRRGRRVRRVAIPGKDAFTDFQLGEQEGRIVLDHLARIVGQIDRVVSYESAGPTMEDVTELAGIAC